MKFHVNVESHEGLKFKEVVQGLSDSIERQGLGLEWGTVSHGDAGVIRDTNGNTIGTWEVTR